MDPINKTLVIRFSSIGDIILSSPLVRILRRHHPDAQIDFLIKEEYAELMEGNPHLSRLIVFPRNGSFGRLRDSIHGHAAYIPVAVFRRQLLPPRDQLEAQ